MNAKLLKKLLKISPVWRLSITELLLYLFPRISSLQHFSRKSMPKSCIQLSHYKRCQTQRPKKIEACRLFQIHQWNERKCQNFCAGQGWDFEPPGAAADCQALIGEFDFCFVFGFGLKFDFDFLIGEILNLVNNSGPKWKRSLLEEANLQALSPLICYRPKAELVYTKRRLKRPAQAKKHDIWVN